jgi:hypothetical protein
MGEWVNEKNRSPVMFVLMLVLVIVIVLVIVLVIDHRQPLYINDSRLPEPVTSVRSVESD